MSNQCIKCGIIDAYNNDCPQCKKDLKEINEFFGLNKIQKKPKKNDCKSDEIILTLSREEQQKIIVQLSNLNIFNDEFEELWDFLNKLGRIKPRGYLNSEEVKE